MLCEAAAAAVTVSTVSTVAAVSVGAKKAGSALCGSLLSVRVILWRVVSSMVMLIGGGAGALQPGYPSKQNPADTHRPT